MAQTADQIASNAAIITAGLTQAYAQQGQRIACDNSPLVAEIAAMAVKLAQAIATAAGA